nr:MAG TPA: hypothetical protein [Caudoviricetes sp.]
MIPPKEYTTGAPPSTSTTALRVVVLTWIVIVFMVDTSKRIFYFCRFRHFIFFNTIFAATAYTQTHYTYDISRRLALCACSIQK